MAAAAYRAGEKLHSKYYGEDSDYTRKGGVICSEILLPSHAPPEYADRETLWNAVEKAERGKNAQLAYSAEHDNELRTFYMAERKLKLHFKDGKLPITAWRDEKSRLETEYRDLQQELTPLYADVKKTLGDPLQHL